MHSPANTPASADSGEGKVSNFLRQIIDKDLAQGTYASRRWAGSPGDAAHHAQGQPDPARIRTRFPPEPNGYLHVGHAKSICLNFGLARDYGGVCHLRFDDTNPEKEDQEYVHSIIDAVKWLGFDWAQIGQAPGSAAPYQASDYFGFMYRAAEHLIEAGHAYVDEQTPEEMRANRGDFGKPGVDSPFRSRTPAENLARFREMRDGKHPDGAMVLRAKIDMASPNINLRDPAIYRIRHAEHHHTGNTWCVYPMYTFAHPIEDALEQITHSICTLEFEDQRPFYDWLMARLIEGGLLASPPPRQYEFARLNLTYVVTSKRKLAHLVSDKRVSGWDDPRMPTIVGLRRRGYTPEAIQLFAERQVSVAYNAVSNMYLGSGIAPIVAMERQCNESRTRTLDNEHDGRSNRNASQAIQTQDRGHHLHTLQTRLGVRHVPRPGSLRHTGQRAVADHPERSRSNGLRLRQEARRTPRERFRNGRRFPCRLRTVARAVAERSQVRR